MTDSRLQIRRVHAEYLLPADHPAPVRLRDRLDAEIKHNLTHTLRSSLSSWFSESDTSLWFVRQLELDFPVNATGSSEHVSRTFTSQLGRVLTDAIGDCANQDNVVRFANRAEYLAHFLSDIAAGTAWGKWYYESFFGLRFLPTSAAIRTAVCDEPDTGKMALLLLRSDELIGVLRALSPNDGLLILDTLTKGVASGQFNAHELGWSLTRLRNVHSFDGLNAPCRALGIYLHAARAQAASSPHELTDLMTCSTDQLRQVIIELDSIRANVKTSDFDKQRRETAFGGIFLLLPLLDDLPLEESLADWPHADEAAAISLVRFLILIKCLGSTNAQRPFADPLIRDLLVVPPTLSEADLNKWQGSITRGHIETFRNTLISWQHFQGRVIDERQLDSDLEYLSLPDSRVFAVELERVLDIAAHLVLRNFSRRLPGFAESNLPYLWSNFLNFHANVEEDPTRRVVRMTGPPLRLVLGLTGMMRQTYRLSWQELPFNLFEET
ncbi:MAG TPA: hypothetical protein VIX17_17370 [Pyrinomonadaceae bacterium]|jgi:hypothetical protein